MRGLSVALFGCVFAGCSFLVQFDPESQPCDSAGACKPGYQCVEGLCRSTDGGLELDGGVDGGGCQATETVCGDGLDDDCDGRTDCADTDCNTQGCDDGNPCTTGETCTASACSGGRPLVCNTPPTPCQNASGVCEAGTGRCLYASLADGTQCGTASSARCCGGTCVNTTVNGSNCGGCGLVCSPGQVCQDLTRTSCNEPADTSGRCACSTTAPCPQGQRCGTNGFCNPASVTQCATGQTVSTTAAACGAYCRY